MKYFKSLFIIALAVVTVSACSNKKEADKMENENQQTEAYEANNANNEAMAGSETIVSVAADNPNLSMLVKAVKSAERVEMLNSDGPYTVFAPNNQAFGALPDGTVENLMKPENKQKLGNILAYHVVEGTVMASELKDGQTITTVEGTKLTVTKKNGNVMINGATVVQSDVNASNGVVHVINKVLMPSNS